MDIFVYSDESGVLDKDHNEYYVFAGVIYLSKEFKDTAIRKFIKAEKSIAAHYQSGTELKACKITNKDKGKLFRSLNQSIKFAVIISQKRINNNICANKKSKQRYLDYAYKIGLKNAFISLEKDKVLVLNDIENIYVFMDEHTTATNGLYELREGLLQEFKYGTFNFNYQKYFHPIIPDLKTLNTKYCDSSKTTLIRAADIVANRIFFNATHGKDSSTIPNIYITYLP